MVLRFEYEATSTYFLDRIRSIALQCGIKLKDSYRYPYLYIEFEESEEFLQKLDEKLYNSLFFKNVDVVEKIEGTELPSLPSSIYLCPDCLKELLDPSSHRYYYPFVNCNSCGYRGSLLDHYPQKRSNTYLNFFKPCQNCRQELQNNPFRKNSPFISCLDCNIPLKLSDKSENRVLYANTKEEYKQIFSMLGAALRKNEKILVKTFRGWKRFGVEDSDYAMVTRPSDAFMLLAREKKALFSIERPMMYATRADGEIKKVVAVWDALSTLLAKESGAEVIYFDEKSDEWSLKLDFELPIHFYEAPFLFINKYFQCFKSGQSLFPKYWPSSKTALFDQTLLHENVIDTTNHFDEVATEEIVVFKDEPIEHPSIKKLPLEATFFQGVLRENGIDEKSVGVYFGDEVKFLIYNEKIKEIFSFGKPKSVVKRKVVNRYKEKYPDRLESFIHEPNFLLKAARLLGFEGDYEAFNLFSLQFGGKGGLSIDCGIDGGKFDYSGFYASIMSFVLAGVKPRHLAYSIFESLGDYLSNQAVEIQRKSEAKHIALFGRSIPNHPFFSRFIRNTRQVILPKQFPVDQEGVFTGL